MLTYVREKLGNKRQVVRNTINQAIKQGSRFLKMTRSGAWEEASEDVQMAEMARVFRRKRRMMANGALPSSAET